MNRFLSALVAVVLIAGMLYGIVSGTKSEYDASYTITTPTGTITETGKCTTGGVGKNTFLVTCEQFNGDSHTFIATDLRKSK